MKTCKKDIAKYIKNIFSQEAFQITPIEIY